MGEIKERLDHVLDLAGDLAETQKDLLTIKLVENSTKAASLSIIGIFVLLLALLILLFLGLGFAWWLGEKINDVKLGFFVVGGAYGVLLIGLILLAKGTILPAIRNQIISKIYED